MADVPAPAEAALPTHPRDLRSRLIFYCRQEPGTASTGTVNHCPPAMREIGVTTQAIGDVMIVYMLLRVHHRMMRDHKIDAAVMRIMRREQIVGFFGMALIVVGAALQIIPA